jgi:hypothetical protein
MIQDPVTAATRWRRAREIFDDLVDLESAEQGARLTRACGDDLELRCEVESLLSHDRLSHDTIERLVAEAALDVDAGSTTELQRRNVRP